MNLKIQSGQLQLPVVTLSGPTQVCLANPVPVGHLCFALVPRLADCLEPLLCLFHCLQRKGIPSSLGSKSSSGTRRGWVGLRSALPSEVTVVMPAFSQLLP